MLQRVSAKSALAAVAIHLLTLAALWGRFRLMAVVAVLVVVITAGNLLLIHQIAPRFGFKVGERIRIVANVLHAVVVGHITGAVLPNWLWMPFSAFAQSGVGVKQTRRGLAFSCAAQSGAAIFLDRVPLLYPAAFGLLAFICLAISEARTNTIVDMLEESDAQRCDLEAAHQQLEEANAKIRRDMDDLQKIEVELRHAQKLEAVGRLASGIAHEINTPIQFVTDSIRFLEGALGDVLGVVGKLRDINSNGPAGGAENVVRGICEEADLPYLAEEMPKAIARALDGLGRVASIVRSMKQFAHPDQELKTRPTSMPASATR